MDELKKLLSCGEPWVEQRAAIALDLAAQFQSGLISADEYQELLRDLARTDEIKKESSNIETNAMLISGINILLKLV